MSHHARHCRSIVVWLVMLASLIHSWTGAAGLVSALPHVHVDAGYGTPRGEAGTHPSHHPVAYADHRRLERFVEHAFDHPATADHRHAAGEIGVVHVAADGADTDSDSVGNRRAAVMMLDVLPSIEPATSPGRTSAHVAVARDHTLESRNPLPLERPPR